MDTSYQKYFDKLVENTKETLEIFSADEKRKQERERMACAAFLRCLGIAFSLSEIKSMQQDDSGDIIFREAIFQVRESLDQGRKRGDEYKARYETLINANKIEDTLVSVELPLKMTYEELFKMVTDDLEEKALRYGVKGCGSLDALVYVNQKRFLDPSSEASTFDSLILQGWRSVSLFFPPYSHVIFAKKRAPEFIRNNIGKTKRECDNPDIWFKMD